MGCRGEKYLPLKFEILPQDWFYRGRKEKRMSFFSLVTVAIQMQQYLLHCHVFDQAKIMFEDKGAHIQFLLFSNCAYNSLTEAEQFGTLMFNMKTLIKSLMWNPNSRFFKSIEGLHTYIFFCLYVLGLSLKW